MTRELPTSLSLSLSSIQLARSWFDCDPRIERKSKFRSKIVSEVVSERNHPSRRWMEFKNYNIISLENRTGIDLSSLRFFFFFFFYEDNYKIIIVGVRLSRLITCLFPSVFPKIYGRATRDDQHDKRSNVAVRRLRTEFFVAILWILINRHCFVFTAYDSGNEDRIRKDVSTTGGEKERDCFQVTSVDETWEYAGAIYRRWKPTALGRRCPRGNGIASCDAIHG